MYSKKHLLEKQAISIRLFFKVNLSSYPFQENNKVFLLEYYTIIQPLDIAFDKLQSSKENSEIGFFLPIMYTLQRKLTSNLYENLMFCKPMVEILLPSIDKRFGEVINKQNFLIASCIHPKLYFNWLKDDTELKKTCEDLIRNLAVQCICSCKQLPVISQKAAQPETEAINETDSFFDFDTPSDSLTASNVNCTEQFIKQPVLNMKDYIPCLKKIYFQYNTLLSSSAAVEQVFSISGDILRKKRNRLIDEHFEQNTVLKYAINEKLFKF